MPASVLPISRKSPRPELNADTSPYLIFRILDSTFAVRAQSVLQIAAVPELSRREEAPAYVAGVVIRRGRIVSIIDLHLRFGRISRPYRLEDFVIFLEGNGEVIGVLAEETYAVVDIDEADIELTSLDRQDADTLVAGTLTWNGKIVMVLSPENLLRLNHSGVGDAETAQVAVEATRHSPQAVAELRDRSLRLAEVPDHDAEGESVPFAVVRLGKELFGIQLQVIREFAELRNVAPVPCTPAHIVGQMNLRGEVVTVIDVSRLLGLPTLGEISKGIVVIADEANCRCGAVVDELLCVIDLHPDHVDANVDSTARQDRSFVRGTVRYESRTLSLIDLPSLMAEKTLKVNEKPS